MRCTPIEYSFHDGKFWMFSEGGEKFIGLDYKVHAEYKKIPLVALEKLESPMNLICVAPVKMEVLFSDFKKEGYSSRQTLEFS